MPTNHIHTSFAIALPWLSIGMCHSARTEDVTKDHQIQFSPRGWDQETRLKIRGCSYPCSSLPPIICFLHLCEVNPVLFCSYSLVFLKRSHHCLQLLFAKSLSRSGEGRGDQKMSPELLNKAISTKSTQYICWERHTKLNSSCCTLFSTYKWGMWQLAW